MRFIGGDVDLRIEIYRGQNEVKEVNDPKDDPENDLETKLLWEVRLKPDLTHRELAEKFSVSSATIKHTFSKLQKEGKVVRQGSNRKEKWILVEK